MVDEERLELGGASAQKLCMIAVCYHNIAVELMVMHQVRPVKQTTHTRDAHMNPPLPPCRFKMHVWHPRMLDD